MEIGSSWGGGSRTRYFHGMVDEVSIYNRALSASDIAGIYYAGAAGKCLPTPTVTWTNLAPIAYGTALGTNQLDATANIPGTFVYTPPAGTDFAHWNKYPFGRVHADRYERLLNRDGHC